MCFLSGSTVWGLVKECTVPCWWPPPPTAATRPGAYLAPPNCCCPSRPHRPPGRLRSGACAAGLACGRPRRLARPSARCAWLGSGKEKGEEQVKGVGTLCKGHKKGQGREGMRRGPRGQKPMKSAKEETGKPKVALTRPCSPRRVWRWFPS